MANYNLIRWGGLVSIMAGAVGIAYRVMGWSNFTIAQTMAFMAVGLLFYVLMLFAIMALQARQALQSGGLGRLGFVLVTSGAIINSLYLFLSTAEFAGIAAARPVLGFFFNTIPLFYFGSPVFDAGLLLFGVATVRASALPRWAGILLAGAAILNLLADISFLVPFAIGVFNGGFTPTAFTGAVLTWINYLGVAVDPAAVLMGIALAWMGWTAWSGKSAAVARATPIG